MKIISKVLPLFALFLSISAHSEEIKKSIDNLYTVQTHAAAHSIALTLDACSGQTDWNIVHFLVENKIKATIFVTGKWIKSNPEAVAYLKNNPDIFQIENHGLEHKEAVYRQIGAYNLPSTKDDAGITQEVEGGQQAILETFNVKPKYYRDAGALYDNQSLAWLNAHHWSVGGYTIAGDMGATASTAQAIKLMESATNGDVILAHMNHPKGHTYDGMKVAIIYLKQKGYSFSWL